MKIDPAGKSEIRCTFELLFSLRMLKFLPVIIYSAISLAIYQGVFFPLFELSLKNVDPDEITKRCTLAGVGLGVGETIGALCNGRL